MYVLYDVFIVCQSDAKAYIHCTLCTRSTLKLCYCRMVEDYEEKLLRFQPV